LLRTVAHPRYQVEIGLVKLMEMRRLESLSQLWERLAALEESFRSARGPAGTQGRIATSSPKTSTASQSFVPSAAPRAASFPEAPAGQSRTATSANLSTAGSFTGAATKTALETEAEHDRSVPPAVAGGLHGQSPIEITNAELSEIDQIKAALEGRRKRLLVTALDGARSVRLEGDELCLEFSPDTRHLRDTLAKSENVKVLREVCKEITSRDLGVRFSIADGETGEISKTPISREESERREQQLDKQTMRETAEKDPTVKQMLRTFRGEIVDVKRTTKKS
jgi:hypothetical protein